MIPFDDRDGSIWLDGSLVPWREARLHVLSHGLHYGSSVFEGERVYGGTVFKLAEHSRRLVESARLLGFELPWSAEAIDAATRAVVQANGIVDGYVRPVAWRGSEQIGVAARATRARLAIATWTWPAYFTGEARQSGVRLAMAPWVRPSPASAPTRSKAAGLYIIATLSKNAAEDAGYDDALMLDYRGLVAEATGANLFFAADGVLHTPLADCFLDGITRRTVIDLARARGIAVAERAIRPDELGRFQEAFLTGTAAEVTPIREIAEHRYQPGALTRTLVADYEALVRGRLSRPTAA